MTECAVRFDTLQFPKLSKTPEGYLRGRATVTKVGVFKYDDFNGRVRSELRHPDHVFHQDSLNTLKMIPITNDHPKEMVTAENAKKYQVGFTGEHYDKLNDAVVVTMTITDKSTIDMINRGKHQVSMGYECKLIEESGRFDGAEYTHKQTNIKYNHLSVVTNGRAGDSIRLRFDNACMSVVDIENNIKKDSIMSEENEKLRYDALESKFDAAQKENELLKLKLEKMQDKFDSIDKSYNLIKKELADEKAIRTDSMIADGVKRTLKALIYGASVLGDPMAYISHLPREIMINAINAKLANQRRDAIDFSKKSDEAIEESFNAHFDVGGLGTDKRIDCKSLISGLHTHYDSSRDTSINARIRAYEMSKNNTQDRKGN